MQMGAAFPALGARSCDRGDQLVVTAPGYTTLIGGETSTQHADLREANIHALTTVLIKVRINKKK